MAKHMRRARDVDGKRLFSLSEFLTEQQVTSFSRLAAKLRQRTFSYHWQWRRSTISGQGDSAGFLERSPPNLP